MTHLHLHRCANHEQREAAARCAGCRRFFCRECVTEFAGRMICAGCLKKEAQPASATRARFTALGRATQCLLGVFVAWLFFYSIGRGLLLIPSQVHEGTLWQVRWWEEE